MATSGFKKKKLLLEVSKAKAFLSWRWKASLLITEELLVKLVVWNKDQDTSHSSV